MGVLLCSVPVTIVCENHHRLAEWLLFCLAERRTKNLVNILIINVILLIVCACISSLKLHIKNVLDKWFIHCVSFDPETALAVYLPCTVSSLARCGCRQSTARF